MKIITSFGSSAIQCECGCVGNMEETLCPSCGRNNSQLKQLAACGIREEEFHEYGICVGCNNPVKREAPKCPVCNEAAPFNLQCDCGFIVRFGFDKCPRCQTTGFFNAQLALCGIHPEDFSDFVLCWNCHQPFEKGERQCPKCKQREPFDLEFSYGKMLKIEAEGFIYILINPCMPNMVKIGKTTRFPEERAAELSNTTGVPAKFVVAYEIEVFDCDAAEQDTHDRLADFRVNEDREFFNIPLKTAIKLIEEMTLPYRCDE